MSAAVQRCSGPSGIVPQPRRERLPYIHAEREHRARSALPGVPDSDHARSVPGLDALVGRAGRALAPPGHGRSVTARMRRMRGHSRSVPPRLKDWPLLHMPPMVTESIQFVTNPLREARPPESPVTGPGYARH